MSEFVHYMSDIQQICITPFTEWQCYQTSGELVGAAALFGTGGGPTGPTTKGPWVKTISNHPEIRVVQPKFDQTKNKTPSLTVVGITFHGLLLYSVWFLLSPSIFFCLPLSFLCLLLFGSFPEVPQLSMDFQGSVHLSFLSVLR